MLLHHLDGKCRWSGNETGLAIAVCWTFKTKADYNNNNNSAYKLFQYDLWTTPSAPATLPPTPTTITLKEPNCNWSPRIQWNDFFDVMFFFHVLLWYQIMFVLLMKMYFVMESYCTESRKAIFCQISSLMMYYAIVIRNSWQLLFCFQSSKTP